MTRDNEIANAASEAMTETLMSCPMYEFSPKATDLLECAYIKGAEWADSHLINTWHSVADGDLPKGIKNNSECMPFIVKTKGGSQHLAYYASWLDEEYRAIRHDFFDECDCLLDVEYWMEIPELPIE